VSREEWIVYLTDSASGNAADPKRPILANVEPLVTVKGKPLSFPELALDTSDDDTTHPTEIAHLCNRGNFSFERYFDVRDNGVTPLGATIPNVTAAHLRVLESLFLNSYQTSSRLQRPPALGSPTPAHWVPRVRI
jgi:hypothetical protein